MADDIRFSRPPPNVGGEEGLFQAPRRITRAEFDRMVEMGLFDERERVELIGGEIVSMMGEGYDHTDGVDSLSDAITAILPPGLKVYQRSRLDLPDETETYPDILVQDAGVPAAQRNADTVHLIVETSDTTFQFDREVKAPRYAAAGFREHWIFHVVAGRLWVYREPIVREWGKIFKIEGDEMIAPLFAPDAALRLPKVRADKKG